MTTANDVASYLIFKHGPMTSIKLQMLIYYCQAWSLVWDDKPLFLDRIEAWPIGPIIPNIYTQLNGKYMVNKIDGDHTVLNKNERDTVNAILKYYANKSSGWLVELVHSEDPWKHSEDRRKNVGFSEITHSAMAEYYLSLIKPRNKKKSK